MPRSPSMPVELVPQPLDPLDVVLLVERQVDRCRPRPSGDPVVGLRQVLAAQPEVDGVVGQHLERHGRARPCRPTAAPRRGSARRRTCRASGCRRAGSPSRRRPGTSRSAPASSGTGWGSAPSTPPSAPGCCAACSAGRPRPSCWPARRGCVSLAERSSSAAEFTAPQATTTMSALSERWSDPSPSAVTTPVTVRPVASVSRRCTWAPVTSVDVVVLQRRVDADHLRVGLGVRPGRGSRRPGRSGCTRWSWVAPAPLVLGEVDADRQVERVQALLLQVVAELLDARLVLHRRVAVLARWPAPRSGPRRAGRAPGRGARPGCSTARGRRSRSARPARCRRGGGARRSPPGRSRNSAAP